MMFVVLIPKAFGHQNVQQADPVIPSGDSRKDVLSPHSLALRALFDPQRRWRQAPLAGKSYIGNVCPFFLPGEMGGTLPRAARALLSLAARWQWASRGHPLNTRFVVCG